MRYDGHTHLNDDKLFDSREEILQNFINEGGKGLVNIGVSENRNLRAIEIAKKSKNYDVYVKATVGLHPEAIVGFNPEDPISGTIDMSNLNQELDNLKRLYLENKEYVVAIGEAGIDYHYEGSIETRDFQKELFAGVCDLTQELGLPLVLHSRDGRDDTIDVLKNYKNMRIYFHCRGYGPDEIKKVVDMFDDSYIGFAGNVTYPKAVDIKDSLLICPQEKIILETDAPYLAPQKMRGKVNQPLWVKYVYQFAAQNLNMDMEYLQNLMQENFKKLYNVTEGN